VFEVAVSPFALVAAMLIMAIGSACQASVGIGMARFVAPLLALIEPRFIPGPMLLAGVIPAGTTAYRERGSVDARGLGVSLVGLAGGTVIGALMLKLASGPTRRSSASSSSSRLRSACWDFASKLRSYRWCSGAGPPA